MIHCPNCHRLLPANSQYCTQCGEFFVQADAQDMRAGQEVSASTGGSRKTRPLTEQNARRPLWIGGRRITSSLLDEDYEDGALDFGLEAEPRHVTWQKVVETPSRPPAVHPPRPPLPPQSHSILKHMPYSRLSPALLFWCSIVVLFFFVGGGVFGIMGTLGRGRAASVTGAVLQITPSDVSTGATMNLRGSGFSPRAQIGLTRDAAIPVVDTDGVPIITSQADGSFTDTVVVESDWISGTHTISAEDATTHKFTSSPIQVTGVGDLQRPAHLRLSTNSLDLGVGDQATNSVQKVALTNPGGGEISWQANATQPWLTISPKRGTFSSGMKIEVEIAADRSHLPPGSFSDQVLFSSSAGDSVLPVKMGVTALQPLPEAVLQVSPAALSFTSNDGGSAPDSQRITISNPGQASLHWTAETNVPWLALSSQAGSVAASASGQVQVSVDTSNLLPGTYNGNLTFKGDGVAMHSLQSISVSVTITPACALAVASDMLTFTAGYQQSAPGAKVINLSTANCSSSIVWKATSHASWLTVSQTDGSTPARPAIGINPTGLNPGTYTSSVTFSSRNGTQDVPVRFTMSQPAEPILNVGSTDGLSFHGGQGDVATQNVTLTNTGSATLLWSAKATTGGGGWLSISSNSGSIAAHQSAILSVTSRTLAGMVPGTYSGAINIAATDQQGRAVAGSPQRIPVSKVVNASPPTTLVVEISNTTLGFSTTAGTNPASQTVTITNSGNDSLSWKASTPSQPWLSVSPGSGSNVAGASSTITIAANVAGLAPGPYEATVVLTPSSGPPLIVKASLKIGEAAPTPTITPNPTPVPTATPQPSPTPTAIPTPIATATPSPNPPTPTPASRGAPPPVNTVVPSPSPNPTQVPTPLPTAAPSPVQPTPVSNLQNAIPTPTPTAVPNPTGITKNNSTPPVSIKTVSSPTTPPQVVPTQNPVIQATPTAEPQVAPTQKPVINAIPTPQPANVPPPTSAFNKTASPAPSVTAYPAPIQGAQADPTPTPTP